jgi:lipopolysaccharide/colanic/teichoic acid biosynthesis glycosyltransferase
MRQDKVGDSAFPPRAAALQSPWSHRHRRRAPHGANGPAKASFDRAVAALLLVLMAPVLLVVAVCVKASSPGPVFIRRERVGRDGRRFYLLSFRSTGLDAEETPLGTTLRRYAIDELPQLFNVLMGHLSLVGPRPGLPSESTHGGVDVHRRSAVKPGLIGLEPYASRNDWGRIEADYAENWSLLLDVRILRKTFAAALRGDGAP